MGAMLHDALKAIPAEGEAMLLELVNRIERLRALRDDESILVEYIIKRELKRTCNANGTRQVKRVWTHVEKTALLKASKSRGGVRKFALEYNIPDRVAWHMLRHLRNRTQGGDLVSE